jgi:Family of unknown function (DUF6492)
MKLPFSLYCKSYRTDVKRVARLADSIEKFNADKIPFFVSVPQSDIALFREFLGHQNVTIVSDESIIGANKNIVTQQFDALPGNITQQIVKSEFWRLGISSAYLCLDSDCIFIRPFHLSEFVNDAGTPYTIIDEGRDLLLAALAQKKDMVLANFRRESAEVQKELERPGKVYNFGPNCPVWDTRVWESLDAQYMQPRKLSFMDVIVKYPYEMRWYGEASLRFKAIDLLPTQPFFKMYHYAWQLQKDRHNGIGVDELSKLYCGVVYQSAWEREMDWPSEGGGHLSWIARRLRRALGRM